MLEISTHFYFEVLKNDSALISEDFLQKIIKTYYTVTLELEDLAFAVSPVCRFLGDLFREKFTFTDVKRVGESRKYLEVMKVS